MNRHPASILCFAAFASLMSGSHDASAAVRYTITDLGTLGGDSVANAINQCGDVVGYSYPDPDNSGREHAFLYSAGVMTDLGTLSVPGFSTAQGINNNAQIVGMARTPFDRAALFAGGTVTDLGTLPGMTDSYAFAINDAGQIVGQSSVGSSGLPQAFRYSGNSMVPLGTLPGASGSAALGINANGQIVCATYTTSVWDFSRGFIYSDGQVTELGILPGGTYSAPTAINDRGQVVGAADTYTTQPGWTEYHAFLCSDGAMTDLGTLPGGFLSNAFAINDAGVVVGNSQTYNYYHASVYCDGEMQDLNDLIDQPQDWDLISATGINDLGQIVGWGDTAAGARAFLLTPIPEPFSLVLLAPALPLLLARRK